MKIRQFLQTPCAVALTAATLLLSPLAMAQAPAAATAATATAGTKVEMQWLGQAGFRIVSPGGKLIVLIKPQFEAGRYEVGRGGIVKDEAVHERVIATIKLGIVEYGFIFKDLTDSPILGTQGNKEFLAYFEKNAK